jgi:uncharacterized protein YutD
MTTCGWKIKQDEYRKDGNMNGHDVTQEMSDLMAVYINAYENSTDKVDIMMGDLVYRMKAFVEAYETKLQVGEKISNLRDKLGIDDCEEGCEE